jgi:hypothetical protein
LALPGPSAWFREMVASGGKALPGADAVIAAVEKQVSVRAFSGKVESGFPSENATMQKC